jgi:hypothetical protein
MHVSSKGIPFSHCFFGGEKIANKLLGFPSERPFKGLKKPFKSLLKAVSKVF